MKLSAGKLWGLRRLADSDGRFKMLALDQRSPVEDLIRERRGEVSAADVVAVKRTLIDALAPQASALLLDPDSAYPSGVALMNPAQGMILTLEDSRFQEAAGGRLSAEIDDWSVAKIKRSGADAVKVLVWYRPDAAEEVLAAQKTFARRVGEACVRYDLPYVFELLLYPWAGENGQVTDYADETEQPGKRVERVLQSVETFAAPEYGVDLFKLESPFPAEQLPDPDDAEPGSIRAAQEAFNTLGRLANRPWAMLSAGATPERFERVLRYAYRAGASGYLAGRAIWWQAIQSFPDLQTMAARLRDEGQNHMRRLNRLTDERASRWYRHPVYGERGPELQFGDSDFRHRYPDFDTVDFDTPTGESG